MIISSVPRLTRFPSPPLPATPRTHKTSVAQRSNASDLSVSATDGQPVQDRRRGDRALKRPATRAAPTMDGFVTEAGVEPVRGGDASLGGNGRCSNSRPSYRKAARWISIALLVSSARAVCH